MRFILTCSYAKLLLVAFLVAGCHTRRVETDANLIPCIRYPTEQEKKIWAKKSGLVEATEGEINQAKTTEIPLVNQNATAPQGRLQVTFHMGSLKSLGDQQTTNSHYALIDAKNGKALARVESTLSRECHGEQPYRQAVWVSADSCHVLIYETWCDGSSYHDVVALLSASPDQSSWSLNYLDLPMFDDFSTVADHGPVPMGFSGNFLVFDPLVSDRVYKILLSGIKTKSPPLPFTFG